MSWYTVLPSYVHVTFGAYFFKEASHVELEYAHGASPGPMIGIKERSGAVAFRSVSARTAGQNQVPPLPQADVTAPNVSIRVSPRRIRAATLRRRRPQTVHLRVVLSEDARVSDKLARRVRKGGARGQQRRLKRVGSFSFSAKAGTTRTMLPKRLVRGLARVGRYEASGVATDTTGNRSPIAWSRFRLVR